MKKLFLLTIIAILQSIVAVADSYSMMWKRVEDAQSKDQPKTALVHISEIIRKAEDEKEYGQLLKARLEYIQQVQQFAPDSLRIEVERFEKYAQKAESGKDKALAAVYDCVMGKVYANTSWYVDAYSELSDDDATPTRTREELRNEAEAKSKEYMKKAMQNPSVLAKTKSSGYEPLVIDGTHDYYFNNDLLHVIGFETQSYSLLHEYYEKHGNRPGACIAAFCQTQKERYEDVKEIKKSKYLATIDSLCHAYRDIPEAAIFGYEHYSFMEGATDASAEEKIEYIDYALRTWPEWIEANKLKNARSLLTLPSFNVTLKSSKRTSAQETLVNITSLVNLGAIKMDVIRMDMTGDTGLNPRNSDDYSIMKKWRRETVYSDSRTYIGQPDYKQIRDSLTIPALPVGVYLLEFTTDNKDIAPERTLLRVSDLRLVSIPLPDDNYRWAVLNAITGKPVKNAKVQFRYGNRYPRNKEKTKTLTTDSHGEVNFSFADYITETLVTTDADKAQEWESYSGELDCLEEDDLEEMHEELSEEKDARAAIYTDRAIYRPGQQVHAAAVVYLCKSNAQKVKVLPGKEVTLTLYNTNGKEVEKKTVVSDEFGMVAADFTLPASGNTGYASIRLKGEGIGAYQSISIEEYKRPTFEVSFDPYNETYQNGDTITISGRAVSYAGVPVQGAKVQVWANSSAWRFRTYYNYGGSSQSINLDTLQVITDSDGRFTKRIPMVMPEDKSVRGPRYVRVEVKATVTDLAGESHSATTSLPLSDKPTFFDVALSEKMLREKQTIRFDYLNNAGKPVESKVFYSVDGGETVEVAANEKIDFDASLLASGRHELYAVNETDTIRRSFITYSLADDCPPVDTLKWVVQSGSQFRDANDKVHLQLGTSARDQYVMYAIVTAAGEVLENGEMTLSNKNINREFTYRPEWETGIALRYVWVRDGKVYSYNGSIARPEEDKQLEMEWKTFRNRLEPGQKEEWTLTVKHPDGTPVKAATMAVLYDKSLDQIRQNNWFSPYSFYTQVPRFNCNDIFNERYVSIFGEQRFKPLSSTDLSFAHIEVPEFSIYNMYFTKSAPRPLLRSKANAVDMTVVLEEEDAALDEVVVVGYGTQKKAMMTASVRGVAAGVSVEEVARLETTEIPADENGIPQENVAVRENLDETAFFMPQLVADNNGNVSLKFTLPESITTWKFQAMAHDKDMNLGFLKDEIVAQKTLMIQPNQPRFLRQGDKATVSARIISTAEKVLSGIAYIDLLDPETENSVFMAQTKFRLDPQQTTSVSFNIPATLKTGVYIMKMVAQGKGFSDGEQHYVAVLPSMEFVTTTRAFTQTKAGTKTIDLSGLFGKNGTDEKLTVEYTNNPAWMMVQALPVMTSPCDKDAVSLAAALYANSIGRALLTQNPEIKTMMERWQKDKSENSPMLSALNKNQELKTMVLEETPWVAFSDHEEKQKQLLSDFFNDSISSARQDLFGQQLQKLQSSSGGFSWWPEMPESRYISVTVAKMMARLNKMVRTSDVSQTVLNKVMKYLDNEAAREVKELKRLEKEGVRHPMPSEFAIDYLYAQAIRGGKITESARVNSRYLLSLLKDRSNELTIYGKSHLAVVFALTPAGPDVKQSQQLMESLRQYSVATEEMGRYFDTKKAYYSWCDYKIPTEVAAIEALQILDPDNLDYIAQMQQWLLQEKRTQMWNTTINSTDAVYAFLNGRTSEALPVALPQTRLTVDGQKVAASSPTAGLGYVKGQLDGRHTTFTAEKTSDNISFGAVYAQSFQPVAEIEKDGQGMSLRREVLVKDAKGNWNHVSGTLKVGDHIKVRITVRADRDLDFVQVSDKRAACMEPLQQLSGYRWGYYCSPRDNQTNYYFYGLAKGTHTVETEYYIDRCGTYTSGTCTAQCAYAPEYIARTPAVVLSVE